LVSLISQGNIAILNSTVSDRRIPISFYVSIFLVYIFSLLLLFPIALKMYISL